MKTRLNCCAFRLIHCNIDRVSSELIIVVGSNAEIVN